MYSSHVDAGDGVMVFLCCCIFFCFLYVCVFANNLPSTCCCNRVRLDTNRSYLKLGILDLL